jgi:pseudaminic acid cytidylyltransferase
MRIAIIPARGGSKRIPGKNKKLFLGKPVVAYSVQAALESKLFDEVMVSTDDDAIAEIALQYGAKVPFRRSAKNASDTAGTADVIKEVLETYAKQGKTFEHVCCIYPCAPLITAEKLKQAFSLLSSSNFDTVFPIMKYSSPIQRALKFKSGKVEMFSPEYQDTRTQDLEPSYFDAGQFYFFRYDSFVKKGDIWTDNTTAMEVNEMEAQDIDNETDWKLAELKYSLMNSK